jgi:hypothetical protein
MARRRQVNGARMTVSALFDDEPSDYGAIVARPSKIGDAGVA